jgi:hypothetical protein
MAIQGSHQTTIESIAKLGVTHPSGGESASQPVYPRRENTP